MDYSPRVFFNNSHLVPTIAVRNLYYFLTGKGTIILFRKCLDPDQHFSSSRDPDTHEKDAVAKHVFDTHPACLAVIIV
jgi:hypothetical protein